MTFTLWRGSTRLGSIAPLDDGETPTAVRGGGRLILDRQVADLSGSTQMRTSSASAVVQFESPPVDFDEIIAKGAPSGAVGFDWTPGRALDAQAAAPMRDEFILRLQDESGRLMEPDAISLTLIKWPDAFSRNSGLDRTQWIVQWASRAT